MPLKDKLEGMINGNGTILRILTPSFTIILSVLCTLILANVTGIKTEIQDLSTHFTNHLQHHQELEVGYERRITAIETRLDKK